MTREEAIDTLKNGFWWDRKRLDKAIDTAVSALRPVSRKQVKKVWGGANAVQVHIQDKNLGISIVRIVVLL